MAGMECVCAEDKQNIGTVVFLEFSPVLVLSYSIQSNKQF